MEMERSLPGNKTMKKLTLYKLKWNEMEQALAGMSGPEKVVLGMHDDVSLNWTSLHLND